MRKEGLQQLAQQAQQVNQDSIATTRLDENTVQEFGQLSRSVNRMLAYFITWF